MDLYAIIIKYMYKAFLLGAWYGQAEFEQYLDNQFVNSALESIYALNTGKPMFSGSTGRTVSYNLRSEKWRQAIFRKKDDFEELIPKMYQEIKESIVKNQLELFFNERY